jgi:hypothetical protein
MPRDPSASAESSRSAEVPDDIKIIAQFLAARERREAQWRDYARDAAKLRRELKARGSFRLTRS